VEGEGPSPRDGTGASGEAGAGAAFDELFTRYHLPLIEYLYGMTRERELAADLAQDTFVRAYASTHTLAGIAYPQAWLYRIATNVALNALRHQRHFEWLPLSRVELEAGSEGESVDSADRWPTPPLTQLPYEDLAATVVERDAVWSVLAELPPRWRAVLLLQTTGGFEVGEIAALLGLSEANVRKLLFRAKERFRALHAQLSARGGPA
jgi:RNA polymerase sigma-70 factor (ECF subfamily)